MKIQDLTTVTKPEATNLLDIDLPLGDNISTATIAVVGDPPDSYEVLERGSFKGANFKQFYRLCSSIDLPRYQMYLTNCIKAKMPRKYKSPPYPKLCTPKGFRCPEWGELQLRLINELKEFPGSIIMCMGETAMTMLLDSPRFDSITKFRGSIYPADDFPHLAEHLPGKFICLTYSVYDCSPRMKPLNFYTLINDFNKALALDDDSTLLLPPPTIITSPSYSEVMDFYSQVMQQPETSIDIEATPTHVTCFALTLNPTTGMCVPLMNNSGNYWTPSQEVEIWRGFAAILENPKISKIAQNGMFDFMFLLRTLGIKTTNFSFDTMIAQHICWTDLPKGLDFLTSIYTYYPYYKDEGKQSHLKAIKNWPMYWEYNAKDAIYTHAIKNELTKELTKFNAWGDFDYMMNLHAPLMEMEFTGIATEQKQILNEKHRLERKLRALQHGLNKISKQTLNMNSPKQMIAYFYGHCMIKPYINRATGRSTCDGVALSRIARKKVRGSIEARIIMKMRKYHKLLSTYFTVVVDDDKRLRCTYKIAGTVSGRISSERTYFGTGTNLMNQPPAFKKYLCADPDYILIEVDLARAEAHCVAYLSQDANMMQAFESKVDVHKFNASKIFGVDVDEVTSAQRQMGKKVVHASNYNMGPQTFSDNLAKEETYMSKGECSKLLKAYQARFPGLKRWHKQIDDEVLKTRVLYNLFGRPKKFLGMLDGHTLRNAYSYIPQSTVAELLNRAMIKWYFDPWANNVDFQFLATVHDSTLFQIHKKEVARIPAFLQCIETHMSHEFTHKGRKFTIGLDAKIGTYWGKGMLDVDDFSQETVNGVLTQLNFL